MHTVPSRDIIDAVANGGMLANRYDIEAEAQEWADQGFQAKAVSAWLLAGVGNAVAARQLADLGIFAEQVAIPFVVDDCESTLGFAMANGDITLAELKRVTAKTKE